MHFVRQGCDSKAVGGRRKERKKETERHREETEAVNGVGSQTESYALDQSIDCVTANSIPDGDYMFFLL